MGVKERFVQILNRSGMAQAELARRLDVPRTWVNRRITGTVAIAADEVPRLAAALGVPIIYFYADPEVSPPPTAGMVAEELTRYLASADTPEGHFMVALAALLRSYREKGGAEDTLTE